MLYYDVFTVLYCNVACCTVVFLHCVVLYFDVFYSYMLYFVVLCCDVLSVILLLYCDVLYCSVLCYGVRYGVLPIPYTRNPTGWLKLCVTSLLYEGIRCRWEDNFILRQLYPQESNPIPFEEGFHWPQKLSGYFGHRRVSCPSQELNPWSVT